MSESFDFTGNLEPGDTLIVDAETMEVTLGDEFNRSDDYANFVGDFLHLIKGFPLLNGGNATTTSWEDTLDGGNATTTSWENIISGGSAGTMFNTIIYDDSEGSRQVEIEVIHEDRFI